ncbi:type VI secretion system baseplate subunit TssG [Delftia sp. PS-11]|uniref:type VI secretion system baseplate subunit TssG n=1 Tax=Delftia sp. PS-11 TaxID=2767222 RepID=UPI0024571857|nr:type VI secretion system baseplate subunit TssG [Delftia sp. PS-11]KAJ8743929.1 type VI secretion system baseplate subunit TssG [Delftia sp. PS-11]
MNNPALPSTTDPGGDDVRARLFWQRLREQPYRFDLMHSLRYLQARHPELPRLGTASRPRDEPLRMGQDPSLAFAPATIAEVLPSRAGEPERMTVWNFGLYGPNGPLPTHITEYVRERLRQHDDATLARFSDIFHHRLLLLLFRAWSDTQPTASLDRPGEDHFGRYIDSIINMGLPSQQERDNVPDHAKRCMAGHLTRWSRNPEGLCQALSHFFQVPVRMQENCLHYLELEPDQQTRLQARPCHSRLGVDAVVGARVPDAQSKFRLVLGPMDLAQYQLLLPRAALFQALVDWVRSYLGIEYAWDYALVLRRQEVPAARLGGSAQLGWTTWLTHADPAQDASDFRLDPEAWLRQRRQPVRGQRSSAPAPRPPNS